VLVIAVESAAEARSHAGTEVSVVGTARDAKLAAAIVTASGLVVYCLGLDRWPAEIAGKPVVARGTLEHTDRFVAVTGPGGEVGQGTSGPVWALRDCRYETVR